jgi:HK97 family phage portal protein
LKNISLIDRLSFLINPKKVTNALIDDYRKDYFAGNNVTLGTPETANNFSAVWACLRVLAETFASVSIAEYKKDKKGDREQTDDTGLFDVLHNKPNELMSPFSFNEALSYNVNLGGNAYCLKQKNYLGGVVGLVPLKWERVSISYNKDTNTLIYTVDGTKQYTRQDILHVAGPSSDGIVGMSVIEAASSAICLGQQYQKFGMNFFKNGIAPTGMFEHPSHFSDEDFDRFKTRLKKQFSTDNQGAPLILEDGLKFSPLTMKLIDAEFLSSRKFQLEEICRYCRVPLHLVQNLDRATFSNIEHMSLEFVMYTMLPWFKRFEDAINSQLLTAEDRKNGYHFEYKISSLVRGDLKSRYEAYNVGRNAGFLSVNDIRRLENLKTIPNGDIYLQPVNMVEAGKDPVQQGSNEEPKMSEDILAIKREKEDGNE